MGEKNDEYLSSTDLKMLDSVFRDGNFDNALAFFKFKLLECYHEMFTSLDDYDAIRFEIYLRKWCDYLHEHNKVVERDAEAFNQTWKGNLLKNEAVLSPDMCAR